MRHADSPLSRREYYYSNLMNIGLIVIMLIGLTTNLFRQFNTNWNDPAKTIVYLYLYIFLLGAGTINLMLNSRGYYNFSRIVLTLLIPFTIYFLPPLLKSTGVGMYLNFPYLPIGFMITLHFLFIKKKDQHIVLGMGGFFFLLAIFTKNYLALFVNNQEVQNFQAIVEGTWISMQVIPGTLYIFCFITIYYAFGHSRKHEAELMVAKGEIETQNDQLVELNKSKDRFHTILAHDLKGSFNSMQGLSKLMQEKTQESQHELAQHAKLLHSASENTYKLLENLLEWSRIQTDGVSFNPEKLILSEVFEETTKDVQAMADDKSIELQSSCDPNLEVLADRNMIKTAIRNLLSNAIKFTPASGQIDISCQEESERVKIRVQDSGVGMNQKLIDKLFKIDEKVSHPGTNDEKGTGLGLLLVKEFVEKNGGEISVQSEVGKGSVFTIELAK